MTDFGPKIRRPLLLVSIAFALLILLIYGRTLPYEPINYDDYDLIFDNQQIRELSLDRLAYFFTPGTLYGYMPLRWISYAIDFELWNGSPIGMRAVNLFLYWLTALFAVLYVRSLNRLILPDSTDFKHWLAATIAGVAFIAHPLHVEAVVWLTGRKEVLMGVFFFAGLWAYTETHRAEKIAKLPYYALAFLCFVCALLSKTFAIVFPVAMLVTDAVANRSWSVEYWVKRILGYIPFALVNIWFIKLSLAVSLKYESVGQALVAETYESFVPNRFYLVGQVLAQYMRMFLIPDPLTVQYLYELKMYLTDRFLWIDLAAVLAIFGITIWALRNYRRWAFPGLFFFGCLIPGSGLIPTSLYWADRYVFLSILGPAVAIGWLVSEKKALIKALGGAVIVIWIVISIMQSTHWQNTRTLFEYTLERDPRHNLAMKILAEEYYKAGEKARALKMTDQALTHYPQDDRLLAIRGILMFESGEENRQAAIEWLQNAVAANPKLPGIRKNLAMMLARTGVIEAAIDNYYEAVHLLGDTSVEIVEFCRFLMAVGHSERAKVELEILRDKSDREIYPYKKADLQYAIDSISQGARRIPLSP